MGEDDVFLETFEEDMKYSDTPVAASVSESLADIFQPLYNFYICCKRIQKGRTQPRHSESAKKISSHIGLKRFAM